MKKSIGLLLILGCLSPAVAQENSGNSDEQVVQSEAIDVDNKTPKKQSSHAPLKESASSAENYRPSEDISEDLSVSFPVDI